MLTPFCKVYKKEDGVSLKVCNFKKYEYEHYLKSKEMIEYSAVQWILQELSILYSIEISPACHYRRTTITIRLIAMRSELSLLLLLLDADYFSSIND